MSVQKIGVRELLKNCGGRAAQVLGLRLGLFLVILAAGMAAVTLPAIALAGDGRAEQDCPAPTPLPDGYAGIMPVPTDCNWATLPVEPTATPIGDKRKPTPTPEPTATPTPEPTPEPTREPTPEPTEPPTPEPTQEPTAEPTPEPTKPPVYNPPTDPDPSPNHPAPSVTATRGGDATTASVSWSKYGGSDFDYYRVVVCPDANFIGGTCSNNVFTSGAYYNAGETGPVSVTGLDAQTGYGVILQVWRTGGAGALKPNTTIPAAQASNPPPSLSFGDAAISNQSWTQNAAISTLTLPEATGGSGAIAYALSPSLPAGLSFDATARTISGTPTAAAASASYTYTATDGTDTAALSFSIEVAANEVAGAQGLVSAQGGQIQAGLSWVTAPPTLLEWTQGVAVNVTLPAATGDPNITYKLSQGCGSTAAQLPPGITWNASTRTFSGTPTKWFATRAACYQAYASNKSAPSVTIHIRVADTSGNHAPYASIKSSGSQLLGQLWSRYGHCYSGSATFAPGSGHSKHFYDPEDDTLTYTAGSNKLVSTTINSSGYAVATLRHPPLNWYSFHYTATDPDGLYDSISLEVKHFDCKDTLSVQENKPKDTVVGSVGGPNKADGSSFTLNGDVATYFDHRLQHRPDHGQGRDDAGLRDQDLVQRELPVHRREHECGRQPPRST